MSQDNSPIRISKSDEGIPLMFDTGGYVRAATREEAALWDVLRELYGSYRSLVAVTHREDAMQWDGPCCVRATCGGDF